MEYLIRKRLVGIGEFGWFGVVVLGILCKRLRGWELFGCFRFGVLGVEKRVDKWGNSGVLLGGWAVEKRKWGDGGYFLCVKWVVFVGLCLACSASGYGIFVKCVILRHWVKFECLFFG